MDEANTVFATIWCSEDVDEANWVFATIWCSEDVGVKARSPCENFIHNPISF